jgi:RNA polymerase sigma-70 factor (ECF subfamily)
MSVRTCGIEDHGVPNLDQQASLDPEREALAGPISASSDSHAWLTALRGTGAQRDQAVASLHALLVDAARAEITRHGAKAGRAPAADNDDLARQAADAALAGVRAGLDDFRGASRFTPWASKFAILEAGRAARLRDWRHRAVALDSDSWRHLGDAPVGRDVDPARSELLNRLAVAIDARLTGHQRCVLVSLAIDQVPIDVLAERLDTTRGALYATLHQARQQLRRVLGETRAGVGFDVTLRPLEPSPDQARRHGAAGDFTVSGRDSGTAA